MTRLNEEHHVKRRRIRYAARPNPQSKALRGDPGGQAFTLLRITFTVAPILFGLDKSPAS
jgi:hypothetical protein